MDKLTRLRKKAGTIGGRATSRAKAKASASNGSAGGRPVKLDPNESAFAVVAEATRLTQQPVRG